MKRNIPGKRLFVLDTNVLMHDPTALFRFKEHDIFLPMVVLEELDRGKKGLSEVARNARQVSRFIDQIIEQSPGQSIGDGLPLRAAGFAEQAELGGTGRLFFLMDTAGAGEGLPDNAILHAALDLQRTHPEPRVTLVSKDINLRIKATVLGIHAEDYFNDQVLDDVNLLYSGSLELPEDFWDRHVKLMDSRLEPGRSLYRISGPSVRQWLPNQFLHLPGDAGFTAVVRDLQDDSAMVQTPRDFSESGHAVWGIHARNREQNFALNLLMDPQIDFVTLVGTAGTGKTLLTLAAGLAQTLDEKRYSEIIMTRVTVPVGEDIGFLPGTEEEKMTPWMGALMDNLEVLTQPGSGGDWARAATSDLLMSKVKIRSLNFMRGRTFLNRYIILDEAQNLTAKQMKTLITRAGPGTKVVCLGNIGQIDTPYLTETSSGLTYVVDRFKHWPHSGHMSLQRGERSRLADFASTHL